MDLVILRSRVMPGFITGNAIAAFSEECVAKFVHGVLLLYLVVSSAKMLIMIIISCVRISNIS